MQGYEGFSIWDVISVCPRNNAWNGKPCTTLHPWLSAVLVTAGFAEMAQRQADVARLGAWGALVMWAKRPNAHPGDVLALKMLGDEPPTWHRHWPAPEASTS
jgi:hypothetical protein